MSSESPKIYEFGPFRLDTSERVLTRDEHIVGLSPKVMDLLSFLVERHGRVINKAEILKELWPDKAIDEANLSQTLYLLRQTLGKDHNKRYYVETIPRRGYRFVANVKQIDNTQPDSESSAITLAVLPLLNASGDTSAEFFSDGLTETIINLLSQMQNLRVLSRSSVFRYKGQSVDPKNLGRELGVRFLFSGKVISITNRLVIQVELVDTNKGWQLWGEQYNRQSSDVFEVQESIAKEIVEGLHIKLGEKEKKLLTRRPTENTEAYYMLLRGFHLIRKMTVESMLKSVDCFQQAIILDPKYALAYAGLSQVYATLAWIAIGVCSSKDVMPRAKEAAFKALEIDPSLAEGYTALGLIKTTFEWDWDGAEQAFKKAIECNPHYADAYLFYGYLLAYQRKSAHAIKMMKHALTLEPLDLMFNTALAWIFYYSSEFDSAIEQCEKTLELDPHHSMALLALALSYQGKQRYSEALEEIDRAITYSRGSAYLIAVKGRILAYAGKTNEARDILAELQHLSQQRYISPFIFAMIHEALDEKDQTFAYLEKAFEECSSGISFLNALPLRDSIQKDQRFINFLQCAGFVA